MKYIYANRLLLLCLCLFTLSIQQVSANDAIIPAVVTIQPSATNDCSNIPITYSASVTTLGGAAYPATLISGYQWYLNGMAVSSSAQFTDPNPTNGDQVYVEVTVMDDAGGSGTAVYTSSTFTLGFGSTVTPSITISASTPVSCVNTNVTFTAYTVDGGASPTYQWLVNGIAVGTNSNTYTTNSLVNGDVVQCLLTSSAPCASPATVSSNNITANISALNTPTITIAATANVICPGTTVTLNVTNTQYAGTAPDYQWKINGVNIGSNSPSLVLSSIPNGAIVNCILTSNDPCVTTQNATSNSISFVVKNQFTPVVTMTTNPTGPQCVGTTYTFTASGTFSGTAPVFSWLVNGTTVFSGSNTFVTSSLNDGDVVVCNMLSSSTLCLATNPTPSAGYTVQIVPTTTPSVTIAATTTTICAGSTVTFTATGTGGGSAANYQWYKNGSMFGVSAPILITPIISNGDVFTCVLTSSALCPSTPTDTSNPISITVLPVNPVTVTIDASEDTICVDRSVQFSVTSLVNGGTAPIYQWQVNGINVGTNSPTYTSTTLANNDYVVCNVISNVSCPITNPNPSNGITMTVFQPATPFVAITPNNSDICIGDTVTFVTSVTDGGDAPVYQWFWNNLDVNNNSDTYQNTILENTDYIYCVLTSNARCLTKLNDTSNIVTMSVSDNITPAISITQNASFVPVGSPVTYTATTTVLPPYTISWYRNGTLSNTTSTNTWTTNVATATDSVYAIISGFSGCYLGNSAVSNKTYMKWPTSLGGYTDMDIVLYPNPAQSQVGVVGVQVDDAISVFDVSGKLVYATTSYVDGTVAIDISEFAKGIYQVRVARGNYVQTNRLVKQ